MKVAESASTRLYLSFTLPRNKLLAGSGLLLVVVQIMPWLWQKPTSLTEFIILNELVEVNLHKDRAARPSWIAMRRRPAELHSCQIWTSSWSLLALRASRMKPLKNNLAFQNFARILPRYAEWLMYKTILVWVRPVPLARNLPYFYNSIWFEWSTYICFSLLYFALSISSELCAARKHTWSGILR